MDFLRRMKTKKKKNEDTLNRYEKLKLGRKNITIQAKQEFKKVILA